MKAKEFLGKYGFVIGFCCELCAATFIMGFLISGGGSIFLIIGIILFVIGTFFMLTNVFNKNHICTNNKKVNKIVESEFSNKESERLHKLEEENKRLNKLIKSNKKRFNITIEKYCNIAGYIILSGSALLFLIYIICGIVNFINSSIGGNQLLGEALMTVAMLQFLEAFIFLTFGIIFSAILFALSKIIKTLSNKKNESEKYGNIRTK